MPDPQKRFPELPPQKVIDPLEGEELHGEERAPRQGVVGRCIDSFMGTCRELVLVLLPYLVAGGVLFIAIAVFFGVSVKAAIILLGLGAVGLGVLFAATQ